MIVIEITAIRLDNANLNGIVISSGDNGFILNSHRNDNDKKSLRPPEGALAPKGPLYGYGRSVLFNLSILHMLHR